MNNFIEQQIQIVSSIFTEKSKSLARDGRPLTQARLDQIEQEIVLRFDGLRFELASGDAKATVSQQMLSSGDVTRAFRQLISNL